MNKKVLAHIALSLVALIYGANYIITKDVINGGYIGAHGFILLRVITASVLFQLLYWTMLRESIKKMDMLQMAIGGIFGVAVNQLCFFSGLEHTSPIHASLIMTATPILVLIASLIYLRKKPSILKIGGIVLGLSGAVLLISLAGRSSSSIASFYGDFLVFVNATSYAIYLVLVKRLLDRYHPLTVITWVFTFGLIYVLPFGLPEAIAADYSQMPTSILVSIGYVLLFVTFFAYLLNAFALSRVSASTTSFYIYFQPLIASFISIFLGREHLEWYHMVSAILLFSGVYLVSKKERPTNA